MKSRREAALAQPVEFELDPVDNARLAALCGPLEQNLRLVEQRMGVEVRRRGNTPDSVLVQGQVTDCVACRQLGESLVSLTDDKSLQ